MTTPTMPTGMRAPSALWRSGVSAVGIAVGALVAVPVGGYAVRLLSDTVGEWVAASIVSQGVGDATGLAAVVVAICLVLAGVLVAVLVVLALAAPIFVLVPLAAQSAALWMAGGGLVWRTIGGTVLLVGSGVLLAQVVPPIGESVPTPWAGAVWVLVSGFLARLFVEWRWPEAAGVRAGRLVDGRLRRLLWVWLWVALPVVAILGLLAFLSYAR